MLQVADVKTLKVQHHVSLGLGPLVGKRANNGASSKKKVT